MTEGTAIILLVIAELGVVLTIAGIVGAILWTRRRRREQQAVAALITAVAERQDTRRVTLTGWLTHNLGYPAGEVSSRVDQLLEAETEIYRRMTPALHETDAARLAGIMAGMDTLTHLYRDTVAAAPEPDAENIAYTTGPADADEELTKLGEDAPESGTAGPAATDDAADTAAGDDPGGEAGHGASPAGPDIAAPADTLDEAALDAAWEAALKEQAAGKEGDEPTTADSRPPGPDPLEDLFDEGDDAASEPPVYR